MRKILTSLIITLVALTASNQASAQFRYAATAGLNFSSLNSKQYLVSVSSAIVFQAGVQG